MEAKMARLLDNQPINSTLVPFPLDRIDLIGEDGRYRSAAAPGLEIAVLVPSDWTPGQALRVFYRGQEVLGVEEALLP
jgi:hypothetical protein